MSGLVEGDLTRAATFFSLAFGCMLLGGYLIGDLRLGVRWGFALGVAFGVFAYFFIRPTESDRTESTDPEE